MMKDMITHIDKEIVDTKFKLKQLKQLKKQEKKLHKLRLVTFKQPVSFVVEDTIKSCLETFENLEEGW